VCAALIFWSGIAGEAVFVMYMLITNGVTSWQVGVIIAAFLTKAYVIAKIGAGWMRDALQKWINNG
jgi:hypothetical protein